MGQSLNANATESDLRDADVSESSVKHGQICTNGIGCATGGDRSLGDFLQVDASTTRARPSSRTCSTPQPTPRPARTPDRR